MLTRSPFILVALFSILGLSDRAVAGPAVLNVSLGQSVLPAGAKSTSYVKVSLEGVAEERGRRRTPLNVAIVLDRSGSMAGAKLQKAREAAVMAVQLMGRDDIVSVVTYDTNVQVLIPATKLRDKASIIQAIRGIRDGGNTALFGGVARGAEGVRKFLDGNHVNRVILLSDGLANVGPSSPGDLGRLGASLIREGVSVTTIGLGTGYNEDLMSRLARRSDGNHYFAEQASDLAQTFRYEFGDLMSVVAQKVEVRIECSEGVRPIRVLGRDAEITGSTVTAYLNQLYDHQEKYVLLEVELPAGHDKQQLEVARVGVTYLNPGSSTTDRLARTVSARYSTSDAVVRQAVVPEVMAEATMLIGVERNRAAIDLRDQGKVDEARAVLKSNAGYLRKASKKYKSKKLETYSFDNDLDADNLEGEAWTRQRKSMRKSQHQHEMQQMH